MSCWRRLWVPDRGLSLEDRQALSALRRALTSSQALAPSALSYLLGGAGYIDLARARVAADGHDIEVQINEGEWQTLDPVQVLGSRPRRYELPASPPRRGHWLFGQNYTELPRGDE